MSSDFLREMRDKLNDKNNRVGNESKSVATYRWAQNDHSWTVGLKYREVLGLHYSKDLFGLVFLGNGAYEGQNTDLSHTRYDYLNYTGLTFGWLKPLQKGELGQVYVGLSALYGIGFQRIQSGNVNFYTAPDAQYETLDGNFTLQYTTPGYGMGAGLDFGYSKTWKRSVFCLQVEDLGFMTWQNVTTYKADGSYTYSGEKIDNVLNFNGDSLFSDLSGTGFANRFGITQNKSSLTTFLPFSVNMKYSRMFTEKWAGSVQVYYTHVAAYLPRTTLRAERSFQSNWKTSLGIAYGGFGKGNLLLGAEKGLGKNWVVNLETYFLGMFFLPDDSHGLGLNIGLRKGF